MDQNLLRRVLSGLALLAAGLVGPGLPAQAEDAETRLRLLERTIEDLLQRDAEKDALIRSLQSRVEALNAGRRTAASDAASSDHHHRHDHGLAAGHAASEAAAGSPDLYAVDLGGGAVARFKGIGVDVAAVAGYASESGDTLETLQGGEHDPHQNGFTVQTVDIGLAGALDPWFDAQANLAVLLDTEGETSVELEEAFLQTRELPGGLELRAGHFYTEFGRFNHRHLHDWDWIDQPVVITRLFGPDGLRAPGVRALWQAPGGTRLYLGAQNASGEAAASFLASEEGFEERPVGGRSYRSRTVDDAAEFLYLARIAHHADLGGVHVDGGLSGLFGPNATGPDGHTVIGGIDLAFGGDLDGGRFWHWETEALVRRYEADEDPEAGFAADTLHDWGLYSQVLYGFSPQWSAGLRYDYATGSGASVGDFTSRDDDPFRADRHRLSPLLVWQFAPTAKLRLQYNYDYADALAGDDAHAVWLGLLWSFGAGNRELAVPGHHHH